MKPSAHQTDPVRSKYKILAIVSVIITVLLILSACGLDATQEPISQAVSIPEAASVVSIAEGPDSVRTIEETRVFDQCNASSPFKLNISIGQSETTETAEELVLRGSVGGELGISQVAKVAVQGGLEQHYRERKAQTTERSEGPLIEVPAHTKQQYLLIWHDRRATGIVTYIENGENKTAEYDYRLGYQLVKSTGEDLDCPKSLAQSSATSTPDPTNAPDPTNTPRSTHTPVIAKIPPTSTPEPVPTDTPGPKPTPRNTGLAVGEWYTSGSVSIGVTDFEFLFSGERKGLVRVGLYIKNVSEEDLSFQYTQTAFRMEDNNGNLYSEQGFDYVKHVLLKPGEEAVLSGGFGGDWSNPQFFVDFTNPSVDYLLFSVRDMSSVEFAEWVIPVNHG